MRSGEKVLDIGCGWGGMAFEIARQSQCEVTGISLSENQIDYCKKKAKEWINKNISGIYIDNYSSKLNEVLSSTKVNHSIIRIINSKFPIKESVEKSIIQKIKILV